MLGQEEKTIYTDSAAVRENTVNVASVCPVLSRDIKLSSQTLSSYISKLNAKTNNEK